MIDITPAQYTALMVVSEQRFVAQLAGYLSECGLSSEAASELANQAFTVGKARGLESADEIQAFAEVLSASEQRTEPDWSREIIDGKLPMKARRLRACLSVIQRRSLNVG
jgi:hypothetical protein